jgi:hypothetical protein
MVDGSVTKRLLASDGSVCAQYHLLILPCKEERLGEDTAALKNGREKSRLRCVLPSPAVAKETHETRSTEEQR